MEVESEYIVAGGDINKNKAVDNGRYPIYANTLTNEGIVGYYNDYYRIKGPAVTVTGRGDVGVAVARNVDFTPVVRLLTVKTKHNIYFLENAINNLNVVVESTGVPQLTVPQLSNYEIKFPNNINEERKIGQLFKQIDNLITLHQRKAKIKFLYNKTWEQRKLESIALITMGQSPDGATYTNEPSDYILVQGNADLENGWVSPRIWTTQVTKTADAGDLIMSVRAPAGAIGKTAYNVVIGRGVAAIKGNGFVYQILSKMNNDGYWKKLSSGSTFDSLNSDNIKSVEISIPKEGEQRKIGTLFEQLDNLITLHQ